MNLQEFFTAIQGYYGISYPKGQRDAIVAYLETKPPELLDALYQVCLKRFSSKWKMAPDIAIFEEHYAEALQLAKETQRAIAHNSPREITERPLSQEELLENIQKVQRIISDATLRKRYTRSQEQRR